MIKLSISGFHSVFFISPLTCINNKRILVKAKPPRTTFVPSRQKQPNTGDADFVCVCLWAPGNPITLQCLFGAELSAHLVNQLANPEQTGHVWGK